MIINKTQKLILGIYNKKIFERKKMTIDWTKNHIVKISNEIYYPSEDIEEFQRENDIEIDTKKYRNIIEPWLAALFQSEHLSLLVGTGLTTGLAHMSNIDSQGMDRVEFNTFGEEIKNFAEKEAKDLNRGSANLEDDFRIAIELLQGLKIFNSDKAKELEKEINENLNKFIKNVLKTEKKFYQKIIANDDKATKALKYLKSFLISFSSRTATRDRFHLFTTNYDRFLEYGCDEAGILILDRFIGKILPVFRSGLELDYHYNPPGIRGEPRYVEGVIRFTKLHGSIDWKFDNDRILKTSLPFGANEKHPDVMKSPFEHTVIYPNSFKGIETAYYPYSELFRDFSTAICRPNSVLITFGYGFGDSHINRFIKDMLLIPSTHLLIISFDNASGRIERFLNDVNPSQISLLIGNHFGNLEKLVDHYLPKAAIDRITMREQKIRMNRGDLEQSNDKGSENEE